MELVFAEAGKDNGLLPLNDLIGQLGAVANESQVPDVLKHGIGLAQGIIDKVFLGNGLFDKAALEQLGDWTRWMQGSLAAAQAGRDLESWSGGAITCVSSNDTPLPTATSANSSPLASTPPLSTETSPVLNVDGDRELLTEFLQESRDHIQNIELGVLTLEEDPWDAETLNSIFRAFHTFKGGSSFLNLGPISTLAHDLESLLDLARQKKLLINSSIVELILAGSDTLKRFLVELELRLNGQKCSEPICTPMQALRDSVRTIIASPSAQPTSSSPTVQISAALPSHEATGRVEDQRGSDPVGGEGNGTSGPKKSNSSITAVKVDTCKLDGLVDLVGELVVAQSMVAQNPEVSALSSQQVVRNLAQLGRVTRELQRMAMSLRMVPIQATFQKMVRVVRDVSHKLGKSAELQMSGEDTELDRSIIETISDPLVHMIRNAVDHGIELPEVRQASGKPSEGVIQLRAFHQGGCIVIQVADDGAGLSKEKVRAKAIERGLLSPDENLSDKEIFGFIFRAGFSTAEKVTDVSGRGVGMDVVRRNIEKLRGKVEIESTCGKGSIFSIYLPLTLAIIDGLLLGVGDQRYIIPALSVRESFRPTPERLSSVHERGEMVNVRGQLIPLLRLYEHLGVTPRTKNPTEAIVVVVESQNQQRCLLVDDLLGKQEVVIKSVEQIARHSPSVAGAAILGDGTVGLILDANTLVHYRKEPLRKAA